MKGRRDLLSRRALLKGAAAAGGMLAAGLPVRGAARQQEGARPNILFILTDDHRWDALGIMGHPFLKTPNMDRIAREGALLENAFVTTSLCSPSRASSLTGAYAHRHGVVTNEANDPDPAFRTFPQILQRAGYETAYIGKWHMHRSSAPRPGFDYWLSFLGQGHYESPKLNENGREFEERGYMTDILTDHAVRWLRRPREKPFCMVLSHKAVHGPFTPAPRHADAFPDARIPEPKSFRDTFEGKPDWYRKSENFGARRELWEKRHREPAPAKVERGKWDERGPQRLNYFRTLLAVDEGIGRVLDALEDTGTLDETIVVFAGDNGFFIGEHGRGDKRMIYEESIRIPFLIRYPKLIKPATRIREICLNIDLAPTLLDLAGTAIPATMQGKSLVPVLKGDARDWRKSFFYEYFREEWLPGLPLMHAVRTERWKYATYPDLDDIDELYDLSTDPTEMHNLAEQKDYSETLAEMRREMERLKKETLYPKGTLGAPPL